MNKLKSTVKNTKENGEGVIYPYLAESTMTEGMVYLMTSRFLGIVVGKIPMSSYTLGDKVDMSQWSRINVIKPFNG